jgi:hypothetical protein
LKILRAEKNLFHRAEISKYAGIGSSVSTPPDVSDTTPPPPHAHPHTHRKTKKITPHPTPKRKIASPNEKLTIRKKKKKREKNGVHVCVGGGVGRCGRAPKWIMGLIPAKS